MVWLALWLIDICYLLSVFARWKWCDICCSSRCWWRWREVECVHWLTDCAPSRSYRGCHQSALAPLPPHISLLPPVQSNVFSHSSKFHSLLLLLHYNLNNNNPQASKKTSLNLDMERMKINERRKPLSMSGLSRQARGSSTGSSLSSLSPDEERPKSISSRYSQPSLQQNQRLNKDNLAKLKNRPTKVIESSSKFPPHLKYLFPRTNFNIYFQRSVQAVPNH